MRIAYIDGLRWRMTMFVLAYHVCYLFNGVGIFGAVPDSPSIAFFDGAAAMVYPWFMVMFFVISGMSARYSLSKRTGKEFLRDRTVRLLVPSTLGLFVLHWVTGYMNIAMGGGMGQIPSVLIYPIAALSGTGPLWFMQMLYLFSCLLVLIKRLDRNDSLWLACEKARTVELLALTAILWPASYLLNMPVLTMYRFGIYFCAFLIGYYVISHEEVQNRIEDNRALFLILALIFGLIYGRRFCGTDFTLPICLQNPITAAYLWTATLCILGFAKKYLTGEGKLERYMKKSAFGLYVLHYPVMLALAWGITEVGVLEPVFRYAVVFICGTGLTLVLAEIIKRIPIIRFFVLGIKKPR